MGLASPAPWAKLNNLCLMTMDKPKAMPYMHGSTLDEKEEVMEFVSHG